MKRVKAAPPSPLPPFQNASPLLEKHQTVVRIKILLLPLERAKLKLFTNNIFIFYLQFLIIVHHH